MICCVRRKPTPQPPTERSPAIEEGLREVLARREAAQRRPRAELPTAGHSGLQPGVDIGNSKALWDLMDGVE
jgi:hypothetical protein